MKKSKLLASSSVAFGLFLTACGNGGDKTTVEGTGGNGEGDSNETVVIQMADHLPTGHFLQDVAGNFQERAVELSDGQIEFEYFPNEQLGSISEMGGLVKDGAVDMGYVHPPSSSFLPLASVVSLPSAITSAELGGSVLAELLEGPLGDEARDNNIVPIYSFITTPNSIISTEPVESVSDLEGMKIRGSGGVLNRIPDYFGASSVSINITDMYEGLEKGVADGALFTLATAPSYSFGEVVDYTFTGSNFGVVSHFYGVNKSKWDSYPKNVQEALLQAGEEATEKVATLMDQKEQETIESFKEKGIEVTTATAEQHKNILETMEPLYDAWVDDIESKGIDREQAEEVLDIFLSASSASQEETEEE